MKLFVWEGDGVLQDYSSGMIRGLGKLTFRGITPSRRMNYGMNSFPTNRTSEVVELVMSSAT